MFWFSCGAEKPQTGPTCIPTANPIPRSEAPARAPFKLHTPVLLALEVPAPFWVLTSKSGSCNCLNTPRSMNIKAHSGQETSREAYVTVSTCGALGADRSSRRGGQAAPRRGAGAAWQDRCWERAEDAVQEHPPSRRALQSPGQHSLPCGNQQSKGAITPNHSPQVTNSPACQAACILQRGRL